MSAAPQHATRQIRQALEALLVGELPQRLDVTNPGDCADCNIDGLTATVNEFIDSFRSAHRFTASLANGNLDVYPPKKNFLVSQLKQLHSNLRHLVWQTKAVAGGDYSQQVDFLGEFSEAFNSMIRSLRQKDQIQQQLRTALEELEAQTGEQARVNQQLRHEIRARERAEEDLMEAKEAAEAASRIKGQFLANMSHEIRTPLNGILGSLELLQHCDLPKRERRLAEMAYLSSAGLLQLLSDVLDLSKIEAGRLQLEAVDFSLSKVFEEVRVLFHRQANERGVAFRCEVDPRIPPSLRGDPVRIRQVVTNLVGNAVKFTEEGSVEARATLLDVQGPLVRFRVEVRDTGPGIAIEDRARIFGQFDQVDGSTTRRFGGTGLGLAISQELAGLMSTRIQVESEVGAGSSFWLDLSLVEAYPAITGPRGDAFQPSEMVPPAASRREDGEGPREDGPEVLVAEDNEVNREVAQELLELLGYRVAVAENGRQAVEEATRHAYDAILMDCQMPEMDGFEATKCLRRADILTPIVALTGLAISGDREKCLAAGMDDYLSKPLTLTALQTVLDRWLGEGRA